MKKTQLKNWIAALGIGSGVAFHSGAAAQVPQEAAEPARERAELAVAAMARSVIVAPPVYVVINHEEQYSIWPGELKMPEGWRRLGREQTLEEATSQLERRVRKLRFRVVINHEEQYSIWPVDHPLPKGFEPKGEVCRIVECAKQIGR